MIYVPPEQLDEVWPRVEAGIRKASAKFHERLDPAFVRSVIVDGDAGLYLEGDDGFFVFQQLRDNGERVFYVWLMYGKGLGPKLPAIVREVDQMAAACGCSRVRMSSHRRAWQRLPYFKQRAIVYEREVPNVERR